jgi:ketosteroid isomerase-like protein
MTTDGNHPEESTAAGVSSDIKPISEALAQPREDIVIGHSEEVTIGPQEKEYSRLFHHVAIRSFEDLQALTLIPAALDQMKTLEAVASDDASALAAAQTASKLVATYVAVTIRKRQEKHPRRSDYRSQLRIAYQSIRRWQNPVSKKNVEIIAELYGALARRDLPTIMDLIGPEIIVSQTTLLPWGGEYHGFEGVQQFFIELYRTVESQLAVEEFVDAGDRVIVIGWTRGSVRATGRPLISARYMCGQ